MLHPMETLSLYITGYIMIKDGDTLEQINSRQIKLIVGDYHNFEILEGWLLMEIVISKDSLYTSPAVVIIF